MLENIIEQNHQAFNTVTEAYDYTKYWDEQQFTVPTQSLRVTPDSKIFHTDNNLFSGHDIKLTDQALEQLNKTLKIPESYAREMSADLHAHNINAGLSNIMSTVTIIVRNSDHASPVRCASAILSSLPKGVSHNKVLENLVETDATGHVKFTKGTMSILMDDLVDDLVKVLPSDDENVRLNAELYNQLWVDNHNRSSSVLNFAIKWERLICTNGAYLSKNIANGSLMNRPSMQRLSQFIIDGMAHVKAFKSSYLPKAIEEMANTTISDLAITDTAKLIKGTLSIEEQEEGLEQLVSVYDQMNLITLAAQKARTEHKRRIMEIEGGNLIDGFLLPLVA